MHSKPNMLKEVILRVQASTHTGESVCVCGNTAELGEWKISRAIELVKEHPERDVWTGIIKIPIDKNVSFRYVIAIILEPTNGIESKEIVIRRWESSMPPRSLNALDFINGSDSTPHIFGFYDDKECIEPGWLTAESVVQLKLYNNPVTIWKRRYKDKAFSIHVSAIDLDRRVSEVNIEDFEDESTLPDATTTTKWPVIEIAVMNEEEWQYSQQSLFGHVYDPNEYVIFLAQMLRPDTIAYMVDFYTQCDTTPEHIGFCYILPSNLREASGTCTMPITGKRQQPIGQLTVEYLIVLPLKDYIGDCSVSYARHWTQQKQGLDVGHRGAGNARRTDKVENVLENTVASFNYAARHGADMVELDVQLSKDRVPVIYHDYYICISMKKKKNLHEHELLEVAVKDLTAQQLQMLKLSPAKSGGSHQHDFHEDDSEDNQPFPTLQHVLEAVNPRVGFNIEIKCPMQLRDGTWELDHRFDLNSYIDIILKCILEHAGNRYIILSCFHPDICTMIRLKQNKYPLLFLTQGQTDKYPPYLDTRTSSVPMAAYFALSTGFLGINVHAEELLRDRSQINFIRSHKLILFSWGEDINHSDVIKAFKEQGVDGIIYDKVDEFTTVKENIFLVESKAQMSMLEAAQHSIITWSSSPSDSI